MPIQFHCSCGRMLQAREEFAGRLTRCPACGAESTIPADTAAITAAPVPPELPPEREAIRPETRRRKRRRRDYDDYDFERPDAQTHGLAVLSVILGLGSCALSIVAGIPAIILGISSLSTINRSQGELTGRGLAIMGIVFGAVGSLLSAAAIVLLIPAVERTREAATRLKSANNMKQIAIAVHSYHDANGQFPPAVVYDANGKPLYSWRVLILPFMEQDGLYRAFRLDEPWDSPNNLPLSRTFIPTFTIPGTEAAAKAGLTHYQVFDGPGAAFDSSLGKDALRPLDRERKRFAAGPKIHMGQIADGTSNTILLVEADDPVPWASPQDLAYGPDKPLPKLGGLRHGRFQAALCDGAVRMLRQDLDEKSLRALITRNGMEVLAPNVFDR